MIAFSSSSAAALAVVRISGLSARPLLPPRLKGGTYIRQRVAVATVLMSTKEMSKPKDAELSSLEEVGLKDEEKKALPVESTHCQYPEPPEKPLPGDCCGSGCVRCVWDVYYEELEDYNNRILSMNRKQSSKQEGKSN